MYASGIFVPIFWFMWKLFSSHSSSHHSLKRIIFCYNNISPVFPSTLERYVHHERDLSYMYCHLLFSLIFHLNWRYFARKMVPHTNEYDIVFFYVNIFFIYNTTFLFSLFGYFFLFLLSNTMYTWNNTTVYALQSWF